VGVVSPHNAFQRAPVLRVNLARSGKPAISGNILIGGVTMSDKMDTKIKTGVFAETAGKMRLGAMIAYIASLVGLFLPISFQYEIMNYSRHSKDVYTYDFVTAAVNGEENYIFFGLLTGLVIILAGIFCIKKKQALTALISGALALILLVSMLFFIPHYNTSHDLVVEMTIKPGAFFALTMDVIGLIFSFIAVVMLRRTKKQ
jgi:uncharacterized Tic20 family protein